MAQAYSSRRVYATPVREPRRRRRALRRVFLGLVVLAVAGLAGRAYLLHVYAPRLEAEARTIPGIVQGELAYHGAHEVPLSEISPNVQHAIVAIEDRRFYHHFGIDPLGLIRAAWINLTMNHVDQGGSTLEEQLAKVAITHDDSNLRTKVRTMALAWAIDQDFSKGRVLDLYLNAVYYGQGAYGIDQAAQVYFGTDAAHLTLPEAAFLAALPQAPSVYGADPTGAVIQQRKNTVLADLADQGSITRAQAQAAMRVRLNFALPTP